MRTPKYTPGPWVIDVEGRMVEAQLPNLRNEYEHICDLRGDIKGQINVGNAHLIAAAPAMYEALLQTRKVIEAIDDYQVFEDLQNVLIAINKTLAQAEGK